MSRRAGKRIEEGKAVRHRRAEKGRHKKVGDVLPSLEIPAGDDPVDEDRLSSDLDRLFALGRRMNSG